MERRNGWWKLGLLLGSLLLLGLLGSQDTPPAGAAGPLATPTPGRPPAKAPAGPATLAAPGCTATWQRVDTPSPGNGRALGGIAAGSDTDVWAVGNYWVQGGDDRTLTEHWDGQAWVQIPSPSPDFAAAKLHGVAEHAAADVWAVGETGSHPVQPLALHWSGLFWSIVPLPVSPAGDSPLRAVAARTASDVWAVGGGGAALVLHWDGSAWHTIAGLPAGTGPLAAIAAAGPADVWAVGDHGTMIHWDGTRWAVVPTPDTAADFRALAVVAPDNIWVAGGLYSRRLIEHWDGYRWQVSYNAAECIDAVLPGIAAAGPDNVWAVGFYQWDRYGVNYPETLHLQGSDWASGGEAGDFWEELHSIVVPAPGRAWAVGYGYENGVLMEHYVDPCHAPTATPTAVPAPPSPTATGTPPPGTPVASATPPGCGPQTLYQPVPGGGASGGDIRGFSALRPDAVWVVGSAYDCISTYGPYGYSDRWSGHTWQGGCCGGNLPSGILALADDNIWYASIIGDVWSCCRTGLSHWNGQTTQNFDAFFKPGSQIYGLGRAAHRDAWILGGYDVPLEGTTHPFALRGTHDGLIRTYPVLVPGARSTVLSAASGASTVDVWAVGFASLGDPSTDRAVIEHWDGVTWHLVAAPPLPSVPNQLNGVVAITTDDVWAVGGSGTSAVIEHWDGHTWAVLAHPPGGSLAAAGLAPDDVWAAGPGSLLHWDGRAWTQQPGSNGGWSLDVVGPGDVWLWHGDGIEHYTDPCRPPPVCLVRFADVPPDSPNAAGAGCLACRALVSGYGDGTFRPNAIASRAQAAKLLVAAAAIGEPIPAGRQTFADVPPADPFWRPVEQLAARGLAAGYPCGGRGEPCDAARRPYLRPAVPLARGQAAKLVALAAAYADAIPAQQQTYPDVPPGAPFWAPVERVTAHGLAGGYADGSFRPGAAVTRGEFARLLAGAFFPACFWTSG